MRVMCFFFFKQKTAYEMCGRDWSSDVCSSDLARFTAWEEGWVQPVRPAVERAESVGIIGAGPGGLDRKSVV